MSSARIGRREAGLGSKKRGDAPPPFHGIIGFPLSVPVLRRLFDARGKSPKERSQSVPRPARGDPLSPREQLEQSTDSRRVRDWDPRAQPSEPILFPRLRIHFADFPCLHCSIDQRLAVHMEPFPLFGLQSSHLNICYYHQDLHRRPLRPGSRPRFCSDRRALLLIGAWHLPRRPGIGRALKRHPFSGLVDSADERFARQYRCGPPPEFPLASPRSGIVHHLSGPDRHALTRTLLRRSRSVGGATLKGIPPVSFLTPYGFNRPLTRTHVRLLGPCFKTGRMGSPQADARSTQMPRHAETARAAYHDRVDGVSAGISTARALAAAAIRIGQRPEPIGGPACDRSTSDRGASPAPIRFPPDNFKHSLTLFSKSFSSFPRGTCLLSVSRPYLALDRIYRPIGAAFPNNPTRRQRLVVRQGPGTTGLSPSPAPPSSGLGPGPPLRTLLQTTIRTPWAPDSQAGLFPVRSPLLGESL
ncbi:unnamed protein product [Prunus brigantina]